MAQHRAAHRAGRRDPVPSRAHRSTGRHALEREPAAWRVGVRQRLQVVPSAVGTLALVVAAAGAVTTAKSADGPLAVQSASAAAGATSEQALVSDLAEVGDRKAAISRDSERQALQDAADAELVEAAEEQAVERNAQLKSLARATEERAGEIAKNQWSLPTSNYRLTARFGMSGSLWSSNHTGLDFAAPSGTPIVSVAAGTVTETGYAGSYGNRTIVTLEDGTEVWYCHQSSVDVQVGQSLAPGQQIGTVGSTGNSTGPHLHLEIRPGGGDPVDPYQALSFRGVTP